MRTAIIKVGRAGAGGYPLELSCDTGGPDPLATAEIPASLAPPEPPALAGAPATVDAVHAWLLARPAAPDPRSSQFAALGTWLRGLLLRDEVGDAWDELKQSYPGERDGQEGIRLQLAVDRRCGLARLPWELTAGDGPLPLFADPADPCARVHQVSHAAEPEQRDCYPLLRVLVVIGADPSDAQVKVEDELENLRGAFHSLWGLVDLEELDRPSRELLPARYADFRPHVLHFIGHGRQADGGIVLEVAAKGAQGTWTWTAAGIGAVVTNAPPKLAILNTCRSSQQSGGGGWEIADAFAQSRVPAVIGMQGDIEGAAAARFTEELYAGLVAHDALDVAVARARAALMLTRGEDSPDPWLPCLTLSASPEGVLPARYAISEQLARAVETARPFNRIRSFVNRKDDRRRLWSETTRGGALVVRGGADVGKSGLVRWCLGAQALRGTNVAYVDLSSTKYLDSVFVLRAIARALLASPVHAERNRTALAELVDKLGDVDGEEAAVARGQPAEDAIPDLFQALRAGWTALGAEAAPLIALDHVNWVDPAHWGTYVAPGLLDPFARRDVPGHRIVVVSDEHLSRLTEQLQPPQVPQIELAPLKAEEYPETVGRFFHVSGRRVDSARADSLRVAYQPGAGGVWPASVFGYLQSAIELFGQPPGQ